MKRFIKRKKYNKYFISLIFIVLIDIIFFRYYSVNISDKISEYAFLKIDELSKYYVNNVIKKYLNIDYNSFIKLNYKNDNIISVDIDNNNSNKILSNIMDDLYDAINRVEIGSINKYSNLEYIYGKNGIVLLIPINQYFNNNLLNNIGPKIPVKVNFLENINSYIDVVVEDYGINNSIIKLYVIINIEEILEMPIKVNKKDIEYKILLCSKIINGSVPDIYGDIRKESNIVNSSVK